jgi:uncharacterized protein YeaO (DUF488 family)
MKLTIKSVYELPEKEDGMRILVDRLWPRGLTKEKAKVNLWLKDIAPSTVLRKWFNHAVAPKIFISLGATLSSFAIVPS